MNISRVLLAGISFALLPFSVQASGTGYTPEQETAYKNASEDVKAYARARVQAAQNAVNQYGAYCNEIAKAIGFKGEHSALPEAVQVKMDRLATLEQDLEDLKRARDEVEQEKAKLEQKVQDQEAAPAQGVSQKVVTDLKNQIAQREAQINKKENQNQVLKQLVQERNKEIADLKKQVSQKTGAAQVDSAQRIANLEEQLTKARKQNLVLKQLVEQKNQMIDGLQGKK